MGRYVERYTFRRVRRERIHPFRPVTSYKAAGGMGKCCAFCENIPFNAPWRLSNIAERINPFPTKRINIFPFNAPAQNHYPGGMHKCIPYELFVHKSIILLTNAEKQIFLSAPRWLGWESLSVGRPGLSRGEFLHKEKEVVKKYKG